MLSRTLLIASLLGASAVQAQTASQPHPERLLASNCFQCHGTEGRPTAGFERLAGMSAREIYGELSEMRAKAGSKGIMGIHAMAYTDQQIRQIADYFSQLPR